jgi:hypothetical protein
MKHGDLKLQQAWNCGLEGSKGSLLIIEGLGGVGVLSERADGSEGGWGHGAAAHVGDYVSCLLRIVTGVCAVLSSAAAP